MDELFVDPSKVLPVVYHFKMLLPTTDPTYSLDPSLLTALGRSSWLLPPFSIHWKVPEGSNRINARS